MCLCVYVGAPYVATGTASALITSILDNQVAFKTQQSQFRQLSKDEVIITMTTLLITTTTTTTNVMLLMFQFVCFD